MSDALSFKEIFKEYLFLRSVINSEYHAGDVINFENFVLLDPRLPNNSLVNKDVLLPAVPTLALTNVDVLLPSVPSLALDLL